MSVDSAASRKFWVLCRRLILPIRLFWRCISIYCLCIQANIWIIKYDIHAWYNYFLVTSETHHDKIIWEKVLKMDTLRKSYTLKSESKRLLIYYQFKMVIYFEWNVFAVKVYSSDSRAVTSSNHLNITMRNVHI